MAERKRKGEVTIDLNLEASADDVFDGKGTRPHKKDKAETTHGFPIDAYCVSSEEHIAVEDLGAISVALADATNNGTIRGDEAQQVLNKSEKYKDAVAGLMPTESPREEIIGAMAHKEVGGQTRIDAFTLNTEIRDGSPMQNPITITIKLKSGKTLFWDMPQHKLYEQGSDGGRKEIENVEAAEKTYKISLPRTKDCLLAPGQQRLEDDLELGDGSPLPGRGIAFDLARRGKTSSRTLRL